jgi:hypothetical protein
MTGAARRRGAAKKLASTQEAYDEHREADIPGGGGGRQPRADRRRRGGHPLWSLVGAQGPGLGDLDSHFRYLSGLLLAIGLGYLSTVSAIETRGRRFGLLTALVVLGGVGRLVSIASVGPLSPVMAAALVMELLVTPALAAWQWRLARRLAR